MTTKSNSNPDCEIITTRIFNASCELVYRAWTDPEHLKNWWGPAGFTNTFTQFDLQVGGKWIFILHGPNKGNYPNECEFTRIERPSLIAWKRYTKPLFEVVATFEVVSAGMTKIDFKMIFNSAEECNKVKGFAVEKNEENLDRLEDELNKMNS